MATAKAGSPTAAGTSATAGRTAKAGTPTGGGTWVTVEGWKISNSSVDRKGRDANLSRNSNVGSTIKAGTPSAA